MRWSFGLFVAVPALILALLGMRAVRADRFERIQRERDRQSQTVQLVEAQMNAALAVIERQSQRSRNSFTRNRSGRVAFTNDRVWLDEFPREEIAWPLHVEELIEAARAAEARGRADQAAAIYARIIATEPRLRDWARVCMTGTPPDDLANVGQITPGGLPAALFAATRLPKHLDFILQVHERLRAGQWWLSFEERRTYDDHLQRLLGTVKPDARLDELQTMARFIRHTPLRRDEPTRHFESGTLVLLSPSSGDLAAWQGTALDRQALHDLMTTAAKEAGAGARIEPYSAMPGWKLTFEQKNEAPWLDRQTMLWLGFIALLIVTMLTSLAGTLRLVRREASLARMKSEFVAGVTHDFKSPLTGIRLLVERLAGGHASPDAVAQYRAAAEREISRLERHVDRLLEAQQIEHGRRQYHFAPASLTDVVDDAVTEMAVEAEAKQITLEKEYGSDVPALPIDRKAMTAAVSNLVGNAIKYSAAGTRIQVRTRSDDSQAVIEVEDEGVGIGAEDLRRIFERFYRAREHEGTNGSGLGLSLVKATVDAHGGRVEATSEPGRGSCFTIRLSTN